MYGRRTVYARVQHRIGPSASEPADQAPERRAPPLVAAVRVEWAELLGAEATAGPEGQEVGQTASLLVPDLVEDEVKRVANGQCTTGPERPVQQGEERHELPAVQR